MVHARTGRPSAAHIEALAGLAELKGTPHNEETVDLLVVHAEAYIGEDRFDDAMRILSEAQQLAEQADYVRGAWLVRFAMGNIHFKQERYEESLDDHRKVSIGAMQIGADKLAMNALSNMGSAAIMLKKYDDALRLYDSIQRLVPSNALTLRAQIMTQQGFIAQKQGDHARALRDLQAALSLRDSIGDEIGKIKVLQHVSTSLWKLGDRVKAMELLDRSLQLAIENDQAATASEIHWKRYKWNVESGDLASALMDLSRHNELSDSLSKARFSDALALNESVFETAQKERRIIEQEQALALAENEVRRRSIQRNALTSATFALVVIALLLYRTMRTRQRLATKEKELHNEKIDQLLSQQEMKSINAMLEGQEQERARVSKELHDHVGHLLGTIKHQLGQLEEQVADVKSEQTVQYRKVTGLLDNAAGALRRISHDMAAATLNRFGLEKALKDLRDTIHINGRLQVELNTFGLEHPLERGVEIAVYRIIQEAVSNVLKHAQANEMSIAVTHAPGRMSVLVSDNGQGFDTDQTSHGVGLANIRSRAAALGAKVQIDSMPGKGTTVSVECPVVE